MNLLVMNWKLNVLFGNMSLLPKSGTQIWAARRRRALLQKFPKKPKFEVYFADTKETHTNLDLDYVLNYSVEVPLKYHDLKAEYIMRLSRKAGYLWMPHGQPEEDPVVSEHSVNNEATSPAASTNVESSAEDQPMINTPVKKSNTSASKGKGKAAKRNVSAHSKPLPICVKDGLD